MFHRLFEKHAIYVMLSCVVFGIALAIAYPGCIFHKNSHTTNTVTYVIYPASILPEELRGPATEFVPLKCMRVKAANWSEDALLLETAHDCSIEPTEHTYRRKTDDGEDIIIVKER